MGLFDKMKNVLGGKKAEAADATTRAPSQILREAGIDPSGLKFGFGADGSITVNGKIAAEADRARMVQLLKAIPGVQRINDQTTVAPSAPSAPEPGGPAAPVPAPAPAGSSGPAAAGSQTYTVKSGDTLWKIAAHFYGDGAKYPRIFEANRDLLDNPDHILPGQELRIP